MAEINIKSPALKDREIGTYKFSAKVTWNGPSCCCSSTIDIPGLTIASVACNVDKFTISGFESIADVALDTSREAGLAILNTGALTGVSEAEIATAITVDGAISGCAGSRVITYQVGGAFTSATDALTGAILEFTLPIKQKDW